MWYPVQLLEYQMEGRQIWKYDKQTASVSPSVYDCCNLNGGNCNAPATLQLEVFGTQRCIVVLVDVVVVVVHVVVVVVVAIKPGLGLKNGVEPHSFLFPDWSSGSPTLPSLVYRKSCELAKKRKHLISEPMLSVWLIKDTSDYFCFSLTNTGVKPRI